MIATGMYADAGLRRLGRQAQDAADLALILADPGIGDFTVATVIDQPAQQVRLAIEDFLDNRSTGDLVLVYLSCHGLRRRPAALFFAAADTRKDRLAATGVEAAWVLDQLEHCRGPPPGPYPGLLLQRRVRPRRQGRSRSRPARSLPWPGPRADSADRLDCYRVLL